MGWAIGYDETWKRDIGYGVPCLCDHPDCSRQIDRGLAHVCAGEQPYGDENGVTFKPTVDQMTVLVWVVAGMRNEHWYPTAAELNNIVAGEHTEVLTYLNRFKYGHALDDILNQIFDGDIEE